MKRAFALFLSLVTFSVLGAQAVDLSSISLGLHLSPSIDTQDGQRTWDLSISFGAAAEVTGKDAFEFLAIIDSQPTTLGLTVRYCYNISDPFELGAGLNMFWAFVEEGRFIRTLIGSFAHANVQGMLLNPILGELGVSLPLLTLAHLRDGWTFLPMTELPSLHFAGDWDFGVGGTWQARVTLQPVIVDALQFTDPIGRISDNLLILPTYSTFLRYVPNGQCL